MVKGQIGHLMDSGHCTVVCKRFKINLKLFAIVCLEIIYSYFPIFKPVFDLSLTQSLVKSGVKLVQSNVSPRLCMLLV